MCWTPRALLPRPRTILRVGGSRRVGTLHELTDFRESHHSMNSSSRGLGALPGRALIAARTWETFEM